MRSVKETLAGTSTRVAATVGATAVVAATAAFVIGCAESDCGKAPTMVNNLMLDLIKHNANLAYGVAAVAASAVAGVAAGSAHALALKLSVFCRKPADDQQGYTAINGSEADESERVVPTSYASAV